MRIPVSFLLSCEVVTIRAIIPLWLASLQGSQEAHAIGVKARRQLRNGFPGDGMAQSGGDFCHWDERKRTLKHRGMRDTQLRRCENQAVEEQDVDVDQTWPIAQTGHAAQIAFGALERV